LAIAVSAGFIAPVFDADVTGSMSNRQVPTAGISFFMQACRGRRSLAQGVPAAADLPGLLRHADLSVAWCGECSRHRAAG
jgi:hypothetical protein